MLEDVVDNFIFSILNDGRLSRFNIQTAESSCINLTIAEPILTALLEWDRIDDTYSNDHYTIIKWNTKYEISYSNSPK